MTELTSQVLMAVEAESYIEALQTFEVSKIGSPKWVQQHEFLEKLNMQAALSASQNEEEFVKEFLITHEKIPVLVHELIATETWKQKVFPEFINLDLQPSVMFPMYMVLYHEATIMNILETVMFHQESCEAAEDSLLDLLDYCYRKLSALIAKSEEEEDEEEELEDTQAKLNAAAQVSSLQELERQNLKLDFDISIKAISIVRYITDNIQSMPLSLVTRLLNTHDIPLMLVQLINSPPWTKTQNGKRKKYMDSKWREITDADRLKLTKIEGQAWIAIFQLLMNEECQRKYELTSFRKNTILTLRSHLTDILLDQLPVLGELRRYIEQLSFMDPPPTKSELILEQLPEIRENMLRANEGKWARIAKIQSQTFFNPDKVDMRMQAKRLAETYNFDMLENLIADPPKCAVCGEPAAKRCSRCANEWYCRRECQVKHWKKHKKACDLLMEALAKIKETEAGQTTQQKESEVKVS